MLVATLDDNDSTIAFSKVTVVSCIPSYYTGRGVANLLVDGDIATLKSYVTSDSRLAYTIPGFASVFEVQVNQPFSADITGVTLGNKLGNLILDLARHRAHKHFMDGDVLVNATQRIVKSAFNIAVQSYIVKPTGSTPVQATVYRDQTRLRVVLPVAYTILGILTLVWMELIWMRIYTSNNDAAQYEEPTALAGAAAVLCRSALMEQVAGKKALTIDGKVSEQTTEELKLTGWKFEHWAEPRKAAIVTTTGQREIRWFRA